MLTTVSSAPSGKAEMVMFFFFNGEQILKFRWWGVFAFVVVSVVSFFFLRRVNFPRWVHPVHYFVPPGVLQSKEVNHSVGAARDYLRVAISVVVGGYVGVQVWLFPLLRSQPLGIHPDGVYVVLQLQRTCLLLADKVYHPPPSFGENFLVGLYGLGRDFEELKNEYLLLFREVALLEGSPPSRVGVIFWGTLLVVLVVLAIRGPRRSVFILVIPGVSQVPPVFWVQLLFPVLLTLATFLLLWGWRRSGKDLNLFIWESFFPGGTDPSEVANFFNRLKWFLLATGVTPLVWLGYDLWWVYLNSPSYLFPELNLEGLKGVPPRLDRLLERISNLGVSLEVREDLLRRWHTLFDRYNYLVRDLLLADQLVRPHYPEGVLLDPAKNLAFLLRRVTPAVGLFFLGGLLVLLRNRKTLPNVRVSSFFLFVNEETPPGGLLFLFFLIVYLVTQVDKFQVEPNLFTRCGFHPTSCTPQRGRNKTERFVWGGGVVGKSPPSNHQGSPLRGVSGYVL